MTLQIYNLEDPIQYKNWILSWIDRTGPRLSEKYADWTPVLLRSISTQALLDYEHIQLIKDWCRAVVGLENEAWFNHQGQFWMFKHSLDAMQFKLVWA